MMGFSSLRKQMTAVFSSCGTHRRQTALAAL
jgi:hypothetical protein